MAAFETRMILRQPSATRARRSIFVSSRLICSDKSSSAMLAFLGATSASSMAATPSAGRPDRSPVPDYRKLYDLDGRVMVVLGGGNGIGRQTCHALAQAGAKVVCVDRDSALAAEVAAEVNGI